MKLYEYEAKSIIATYGVPIPKGELATSEAKSSEIATALRTPVAIKAQVLVAGRGKAGGILFADTPQEAGEVAQKLLGSEIKGLVVEKVLIEKKLPIKRELYFGITVDRLHRCYVAVASGSGGVDIEEVAQSQPQRIFKQLINPQLGFRTFNSRQIAKGLGYVGDQMVAFGEILEKAYIASMDLDAELLEMNPLVETQNGEFVAADIRIILDDNALFRHEEFRQKRLQERRELSPDEFDALKNGLDYVMLDGDIGVVGNGAGLVMATLDMINLYGGKPANFLDLGGGASLPRIEAAFKIILTNPLLKVTFVNILGGITLCDEVARGIIHVRSQLGTSKPIVIRLVGTNEKEGRRILAEAGLPAFDSMEEAAKKAVDLAGEVL